MNKKIYLSMCNKNGCSGPVHVVEPGDTLYGIAQKYHTRVRVLLDLNPFVDIYNLQPGDEICIPSGPPTVQAGFKPYVVKPKETVGEILKKLSVSGEGQQGAVRPHASSGNDSARSDAEGAAGSKDAGRGKDVRRLGHGMRKADDPDGISCGKKWLKRKNEICLTRKNPVVE